MNASYDVIVVGGGHAGCEAAAAAARLGAHTLLITPKKDNLGEMSCNPSIGGVGKGTIVREIDALDGLMGYVADMSALHYRVLNKSKGPAVWGLRAQIDREYYRKNMYNALLSYKNLDLCFDYVEDLIIENKIKGAKLKSGTIINAAAIVITTGTFLNGLIHIGDYQTAAGRFGEPPSELSKTLKNIGLQIGRLKTGTPPRLLKKSINWEILTTQPTDSEPLFFSDFTNSFHLNQIDCHITRTNPNTHSIIHNNLKKSAMYSGNIDSIGPRYCPSIEDKVVRFADKDGHQIFLEPEGLNSDLIYPSGLSNSLPLAIQEQFVKSIRGLENVEIVRPGYAIEYDYVNPQELLPTLQTRKLAGLFLAGQINGTTGYEEAAGQGLLAGINAALYSKSLKPFTLSRSDSYIGVMVDDLITRGTQEPYRMMTARAEFRLHLRADNATDRLTQKAYDIGLVSKKRYDKFLHFNNIKSELVSMLKNTKDNSKKTFYDLLRYPKIFISDMLTLTDTNKIIEISIKSDVLYSFYINRQQAEISNLTKLQSYILPNNLNYQTIPSLSKEAVEKLSKLQPQNLAEAFKIPGINPADITAIMFHVERTYGHKNSSI